MCGLRRLCWIVNQWTLVPSCFPTSSFHHSASSSMSASRCACRFSRVAAPRRYVCPADAAAAATAAPSAAPWHALRKLPSSASNATSGGTAPGPAMNSSTEQLRPRMTITTAAEAVGSVSRTVRTGHWMIMHHPRHFPVRPTYRITDLLGLGYWKTGKPELWPIKLIISTSQWDLFYPCPS